MKLSSRRLERGQRAELSMTSMIDVVFLLLIFFMTTSNFVLTERNLDPAIKVDRAASSQPSELEPVIIDVVAAEDHAFRMGSRRMQTAEELAEVLRAVPPSGDGAFVRVADDAPFGLAAAAIQACKSANFLQVSYVPLDSAP